MDPSVIESVVLDQFSLLDREAARQPDVLCTVGEYQ